MSIAMSGRIINDKKKCKVLLKDLMDSVKECQNVYGKTKTLLATEQDNRYGGVSDERFYHGTKHVISLQYSMCYFIYCVCFFFSEYSICARYGKFAYRMG